MSAKKNNLIPYFILLLILFAAYLPVSTFHFALKNDAFSDNFPNKYFMSAALRSGVLPVWNPYMNFGFPLYADMGVAYWNPITWIFALFGYTAYSFTAELLLYVYLGGIFMYRLCRFLKFDINVSATIAAVYMCSGFYSGCFDFYNFLTAAAFLPWLVQNFLMVMKETCLQNSILFSFSAYMVFAGGHPAIPIASAYFLLLLLFFMLLFQIESRKAFKKKFLFLALSFLFFLLLTLPAVYSYLNILGSYERYTTDGAKAPLHTGFDFSSYISFLFPFSTAAKQSFFTNDVSMRNGYFSLLALIACIVSLLQKNKFSIIFFLTGVCMLLLSVSRTNEWAPCNYLPLLKYVTTNGEFRVFGILCFCVSAAEGLQELAAKAEVKKLFSVSLKITALSAFLLIIILLFINDSVRNEFANIFSMQADVQSKIKWLLDNGSFSFFLFADALAALIISALSLLFISKNRYRLLLYCVIADAAVHCCLYLPVAGIGQVTVKDIQAKYGANPKGIPLPPFVAINSIENFDSVTTGLVGSKSYYNKMIGTTALTDYPTYFPSTDEYFRSNIKDSISKMPYLFLKNNHGNANASVKVNAFDASFINITATAVFNDTLVFLQNDYKFWKAEVNGKEVPVQKTYISFIGVPVEKGNNEIRIYYDDSNLIYFVALAIISFVTLLILFFRSRKNVAIKTNRTSE